VTTTTHRIPIPDWIPATCNQLLQSRWGGARRKKADREQVIASAWMHAVPKAAGKRRVTLTVILGPRQRGADVDAYYKSLCDALVHAKMLVDDSPKWCELAPVRYERGPGKGSVIELEDI
jgi:Holliday junction resolvase RusA-like endonuclease